MAPSAAASRRLDRIAAALVGPRHRGRAPRGGLQLGRSGAAADSAHGSSSIDESVGLVPPGVVAAPTRTDDAAEALRLAWRDGASIYRTPAFGKGLDELQMREVADSMPAAIFGDSVS